MKHRVILLCLGTLTLCACARAEEIKIATYNVEMWDDSFAAHAAATQPIAKDPAGAELLRKLRRENDEDNWEVAQVILDPRFSPDVLLVQEGPDQSDLRFFNNRWMQQAYQTVEVLPSNTNRNQHLCVMLKAGFKILQRRDRYRNEPDPAGANDRGNRLFARGPVFVLVQSPSGYKFWVGTTHQKSKNPGSITDAAGKRLPDDAPEVTQRRIDDTKWRNREAQRTHKIIKELEQAGPSDVILLGDMNDSPDLDDAEKSAGAETTALLVGPPSAGLLLLTKPLADAKKISFHNYGDTRHRAFIDHAVATSSMKGQVLEVKVMDDVPLARVASDHFPVMVKIKAD